MRGSTLCTNHCHCQLVNKSTTVIVIINHNHHFVWVESFDNTRSMTPLVHNMVTVCSAYLYQLEIFVW